ncbi:UDP-4-amino-4,6-dideoxy-N-acetyl-beta-L-altrosamine N-acetyltransferase [Pseudomonas japonica]|uniref:UDP-4-amino-4,6-dideoxy-N-acetyl-beta-L-altrosamine N-acetyltransferase n=1 Tax=Pseudomonas japonica TaxID=256466 RepID=A0A239D032_9PSED|nr:UDP-4-amino-4,6-dideoxy-N-acetyl-beta-L-altrosamine N-acetyltransferase [Pseudomonas japonica]SNS24953.1 UDP-4-amino-4,6-dideoxy-N-acetyl-beta-L-altrosamine N-acetyltransferase [Pseudomonas japonica]
MVFLDILDADQATRDQVRALRNHADVRRFMYSDHEISPDEHARWLASLVGNARQRVFVVMLDGAVAGLVSLNAINATHRSADWAFYLDPVLQGKGLGSLVEFWLLDHAFNEAGLEKLNCEVLASNEAVVKMHRKFGFALEGVRRQNILKDGARLDVVLLGITREEWQAQRPAVRGVVERLSRK